MCAWMCPYRPHKIMIINNMTRTYYINTPQEYNFLFRSNNYCYQAKLESLANQQNIKVGLGVNKGVAE